MSGLMAAALFLLMGLAPAVSAEPPAFVGATQQFTLIAPPRKAPLAAVEDEAGKTINLATTLKGKVVVLNFWATWCAPCIVELPTLDKLQAELGGDKFQVVVVSVDLKGMEVVGPFWADKGFKNLAVRLDRRGKMMRDFITRGLPTTFLIDRDGTLVGYLEGHADWASPAAKALVKYYVDRPLR